MSICAIWGTPQGGKTTLAINLAYAISRKGKSVCLISPQPYSELSAVLGVSIPESQSLQAALREVSVLQRRAHQVDELFYVLAAPIDTDFADNDCTDEQAKSLLEAAKASYDEVIVDCPSEPSSLLAAWALNKADTVLLCLGGCISGVLWYRAAKKALEALEKKTILVGSELVEDCNYIALYRSLGCLPKIRIPYIRESALLQNEGRYLYELPGKRGRAYAGAINQLYEVLAL